MGTSKDTSTIGSRLRNAVGSDYKSREAILGYIFALPYLVIFVSFLFYPLIKGLYMSLFDWNPVFPGQSEFIGFGNYEALFADPLFWQALLNTVYFVILTVPAIVILSLFAALGVNRNIKGRRTLRIIFFSPYILTVTVVALIWDDLFQSNGLFNIAVDTLLQTDIDWLFNPLLAMPAIAIATIWWTMAFNFVVLLAARQNISDTLYEAAKLDGASSWQMVRTITIPNMRNPLIFVIILSFIGSFQVFGQPFIMTEGGPGFSTTTIVLYLYNSAFASREFGYAAAIGYVLFMILIAVSLFNYYYLSESD